MVVELHGQSLVTLNFDDPCDLVFTSLDPSLFISETQRLNSEIPVAFMRGKTLGFLVS